MLQKLRSRHPIDLPAERWGRRTPTLAILGGLAVLALLVPLLASLVGGGAVRPLPVAVGLGVLALVLVVYGLRGKPGWNR